MDTTAYLMLTLAVIRLISGLVFAYLYLTRSRAPRFLLLVIGWVAFTLSPVCYLLSTQWPVLVTLYGPLAVIGTLFLACGALSHFVQPHTTILAIAAPLVLVASVIGHTLGWTRELSLVFPLLQTVILIVLCVAIVANRNEIRAVAPGSGYWLAGIAVVGILHTLGLVRHAWDPPPFQHVISIVISFLFAVFYLNLEQTIAMRALRTSEARFRSIFDHSPAAISVLDPEGIIVLSNQSAAEAYGIATPDALIGRDAMDFLVTDDREAAAARIDEALAARRVARLDYPMRRIDGTTFAASGLVSLLTDEAGQPAGMIAITQDISERIGAEETRRELERIIQESPAIAFLWSNTVDSAGDYVSANISQFGYQAADLIERKLRFVDLIHPEDRPRVVEEAREHWKRGHMSLTQRYRILTAGGAVRWVEDHTWVRRDSNGNITHFQGLIQDVTERQQLLTQVREQALRLEQVMEAVPEGVVLLDEAHQIALANPEGRRLLDRLAGVTVGERLVRLGDVPLSELLASPPPSGMWHTVSVERQRYEVIASRAGHDTGQTAWVIVIRDVTERHEAETIAQHQERLATLGHMAAGIAHDFNNIMAVVVLYAQMSLRRDDLPGRVKEYLNTIVQQAGRASSLIQQILDFSRRSVLERGPLQLAPFLKEQVHILSNVLPETIHLDLDCQSTQPVIHADPTRIQQAIMNLALNARDAMPNGGHLSICLRELVVHRHKPPPTPEMKPGPWVELTFRDDGAGIPADVLPHLFQPFFTTKSPGQGSGLGLAQVWGIVTQHGGCVTVASEVGKGTTFTVYLPAIAPGQLDTPLPLLPGLVQGGGECLLVVEDNDDARLALVDSLQSLNYRVYAAHDGTEALAIVEAQEGEIALVLSDAIMPKMGGLALLRALKPERPQLRFILMTGHPLQDELASLRAQGMDAWLLKPIDLGRLSQTISEVLHRA